ncbi:DUF397 domain-containing protein [Thermomonospora umbrina]|uniref:Uncharacterized protein DUF397 n=1 Tax=Thermomonospora umbrina TaxID=111806 RepID=A0A3D9SZJ1_9ACTN|nr:DUF397 domain-containing protein [Thermomonospora umbrina]REE98405.1 uncharacterized protein DUF397 [Thermomonospora umbrina]
MTPEWRKSSRSGTGSGQGGQSDCVEVADLHPAIGIRDSKNPDVSPLTLRRTAFASLLEGIKNG